MDLQVLYNNPTPKERKMAKHRMAKKKKNPVAVYRKAKVADGGKGAKGPSYKTGKVNVPSAQERATLSKKIAAKVERLAKLPQSEKRNKAIERLKKKEVEIRKKIGKRIQTQKQEEKRMLEKGYLKESGLSPKQAASELKKEKKALLKSKSDGKKLDKELKKILKEAGSVSLDGKKRKKKAKKKVAKKTKKKVARKSKAASKRKSKKKKNPITVLSNPIQVFSNPKKKKASKKKAKKKASKKVAKKASKKKSAKKVSKKKKMTKAQRRALAKARKAQAAGSMVEAVSKKIKKKSKKGKKKSYKKAKAVSAAPKKKGKKKYKKNPYSLKSNPFGGAMSKVEQFAKDHLAHDLAEAGGLIAGGAAIKGLQHLRLKFLPQLSSTVANIPFIGAFLEKNLDTIIPLAVGVAANKFVKEEKVQALAKGIIGASVVNIGASLYVQAARMAGSPMAGIIAVPEMNGIIAVPEMGAMKMVGDFQGMGAQDITSADFGAPAGVGLSGGYMQDADFDSAGPSVVAPRQPDSLAGGYIDVDYDEESSDF